MIFSTAYAAEQAAHAAEHHGVLQDPTFWVGVAFCLTIAFLIKTSGKSISQALQARADTIARRLDEAKKLRADAEKLLTDYTGKTANLNEETAQMIARANEEADRLKQTLQSEFDVKMKKQEEAVDIRLKRATDAAVREIRDEALSVSVEAVSAALREKLSGQTGEDFLTSAIDSLPAYLPEKAP